MSMSKGDIARVLAAMALIDKRTVDENDVRMWSGLIPGDITVEEAIQGIKLYYQQHTKPIMPAQLIQYARLAKPEKPELGFHGQPGEILCSKCRGVHYPHEDCSVLITLEQYGVERFWNEADAQRARNGLGPLDTRHRKRMAAAAGGIPVPPGDPTGDADDLFGMPTDEREEDPF